MAKSEKQWLSDVTLLGCICCRNMGLGVTLAKIHHVRVVQDMAQRAAHFSILLLYPRYHQAFYPKSFHVAPKTWQAIHGMATELLPQVKREVEKVRLCRV
ncbi:Ref family recombination enhancement nuclease [Photorhabdus tasmaniensis]|uniref:Uncharacterized protein n=1 Tax=Photorhabdus tasmaniensis TaxID=1004159 RepID=A0ABX0GR21_9GAMM|nr:Ref family recombination enhancement nuclease [Photorhabdus tasmaniensis]NHB90234.1 hypothetical protein [Photorhabdus tasmaniensis]